MITAIEALRRLEDGNRHFVSDTESHSVLVSQSRRRDLLQGQAPFAILLGCSDSRVPAEIIFDLAAGDLFVIRVAGNIAAPSQIGSVELAAQRFGTRLVVVMGHTMCGAILATLESLEGPAAEMSPGLQSIIDSIRPSMEPLLSTDLRHDRDALIRQSVRANIQSSADRLRNGSKVLRRLIDDDGLLVVGAEYSLETGLVEFFDGVPAAAAR